MIRNYYYFTVLSNWLLGFDRYKNQYSKNEIIKSTYPDKFFFVDDEKQSIGWNKAKLLLNKLNIPGNKIIRLKIKMDIEPQIHERGYFIDRNFIKVESVSIVDELMEIPLIFEEVTAMSYQLKDKTIADYFELKPRSISILPIANACQARCWFCFSDNSISDNKEKFIVDLSNLDKICLKGKELGATRFVITGGGEPTLLAHNKLIEIITIAKKYFDKIILITNGFEYSKRNEIDLVGKLSSLVKAGLSVLAISRHHYSLSENAKIMGIKINSDIIIDCINKHNIDLKIRLICVLQKKGIDSFDEILGYISFAKNKRISQVCFKELYVSSTLESLYSKNVANKDCKDRQVPLHIVVSCLNNNNYFLKSTLPWGSPVFSDGIVDVACYTEPSVGWERNNGIARSWILWQMERCIQH